MAGVGTIFSAQTKQAPSSSDAVLDPVYYLFGILVMIFITYAVVKELVVDSVHVLNLILTLLGYQPTNRKTTSDDQKGPTKGGSDFTHVRQKAPNETDALRHFDHSFSRTNYLMKGMASYNFLLSGSRALDLFLPGSASHDSDWDFYVYNSEKCIGGALRTLANCGVIWEDVFTPLRRILAANEGEVLRLTRDMVNDYAMRYYYCFHAKHRDDLGIPADAGVAKLISVMESGILELTRSYDQKLNLATANTKGDAERSSVQVTVPANRGKVCIHLSRNGDNSDLFAGIQYGPSVNIVRGYTTWNGTRQTVQLISAAGKSPIDLILAFYASHVQCFFSAFGAAHLYYDVAMSHKAFWWPENTQHPASAQAAKVKYETRGFTFIERSTPSTERKLRTLENYAGAKVILFDFDTSLGIKTQLAAIRKQALQKLAWIETPTRTWHVTDQVVVRNHERYVRNSAWLVTPDDGDTDPPKPDAGKQLYKRSVIFRTDVRRVPDNMLLF